MFDRPHRLFVSLLSTSLLFAAISCGDVQCPPGTHHDGAYCRRDAAAGAAAIVSGSGAASLQPMAADGGLITASGTGGAPH